MWSVLPCLRAPMTVERRNRRVLVALTGMVGVMGAAAWASVPLYDWFCRVTGFGGATVVSEQASEEVLDRMITVRFDASLERDMPWNFRPLEIEIETKIGENRIAFYEAHNPTDAPVAGAASYNVYPFSAGEYFVKVDCFCFQEQLLQPGERVEMPVSFYVDPEIVNDSETSSLGTIILSYTFHKVEEPSEPGSVLETVRSGHEPPVNSWDL